MDWFKRHCCGFAEFSAGDLFEQVLPIGLFKCFFLAPYDNRFVLHMDMNSIFGQIWAEHWKIFYFASIAVIMLFLVIVPLPVYDRFPERVLAGKWHLPDEGDPVFKRILQYSFLFIELVKRDFKKKYKRTVLGMLWSVLSLLLKAVAGIMEPTKGSVVRNGSIAALLELASGFDGDLTVRENAYLRGAMLGYTRKFMDETYDRIIEFAELQDFQDRPFKQLSSGMKSRLAFSIASLVDPDILIRFVRW